MFHDWMPDFLNNYIQEQHKFFINDQSKIQMAQETLLLLKDYSKKVHKSIKKQQQQFQQLDPLSPVHLQGMKDYYSDLKSEVAECLIPSFIIGKCVLDKVVKEQHFDNNSLTLNYNDITSYILQSKPTLKTNLAFKDSIVKDHYIFNTSVKPSEVESLFIKPRHYSSTNDNGSEVGTYPLTQQSSFNSDKKTFEADNTKTNFMAMDPATPPETDMYMDYVVQQYIKKYVFSNNSLSYVLIQLGIKPKEGQT